MREPFQVLPPFPSTPLKIGISECLVGGEVRHDGGHKRSSLPHGQLDGLYEYLPLCPEVGIGLGVPREVIRLVGDIDAPRAVQSKDQSQDYTQALQGFAQDQKGILDQVDGYLFTKSSPSCGLFRVKVYGGSDGPPRAEGRGIYAAQVAQMFPALPLEENGRMKDPILRENFVTRTFVHAHWRSLLEDEITAPKLIAFHSAYKFLLMAHSVVGYKALGRLLSDLSGSVEEVAKAYFLELMGYLASPAGRGGHANVLSHLQGYVKQELSSSARSELAALIESYRVGEVPLMAPLSLLRHHLGEHEATYALNQLYLQPHPASAGLRRQL